MKNVHFCQASLCSARERIGIFCEKHFPMVPVHLQQVVQNLDHVELLFGPIDAALAAELEAAASAIEAIAEAERHPVGNSFRRRLALWRDASKPQAGTRR